MANTVRVNADQGRDLHPLVDHMTKLRKSPRVKFSSIPFHFRFTFMFDQILSKMFSFENDLPNAVWGAVSFDQAQL